MKRVVFIVICIVGFSLGFTSCRSTAPCGLSENTKTKQIQQNDQQEFIVTEATVIK